MYGKVKKVIISMFVYSMTLSRQQCTLVDSVSPTVIIRLDAITTNMWSFILLTKWKFCTIAAV